MIEDLTFQNFFAFALFLFPILIHLILVVFVGVDGIANFFRGSNRRFR
jgi:hypothetical protein